MCGSRESEGSKCNEVYVLISSTTEPRLHTLKSGSPRVHLISPDPFVFSLHWAALEQLPYHLHSSGSDQFVSQVRADEKWGSPWRHSGLHKRLFFFQSEHFWLKHTCKVITPVLYSNVPGKYVQYLFIILNSIHSHVHTEGQFRVQSN